MLSVNGTASSSTCSAAAETAVIDNKTIETNPFILRDMMIALQS